MPKTNKRKPDVHDLRVVEKWSYLLKIYIEDLGEYSGGENVECFAGSACTKEMAQEKVAKEILRILNSEMYKEDNTYSDFRDEEKHVKPKDGETEFECIENLEKENPEFLSGGGYTMTFIQHFTWKIKKGDEVRI